MRQRAAALASHIALKLEGTRLDAASRVCPLRVALRPEQDTELQVMVKIGTLNSRKKDFSRIWLLSRQFDFEGASLAGLSIFSKDFTEAKQVQWKHRTASEC